MITSVPDSSGIDILSSDVDVELPFESKVKTNRVLTISQSLIRKKVSTVSCDFFEKVLKDFKEKISLIR